MGLENIEKMVLNPNKLTEQCSLISQNYDYENSAYVILSNKVEELCSDSNLSSVSIHGFKDQMSNYKTIFESVMYANELDQYDASVVESSVSDLGGEVLDGKNILKEINDAQAEADRCNSESSYWYNEGYNAPWYDFFYADLCFIASARCSSAAEKALKRKARWEEKGNLLLEKNNSLSGLFSQGDQIRNKAQIGLDSISTSFSSTSHCFLTGSGSWKKQLAELMQDSLVDDDGNLRWDLIGQIASKDADAISDTDYELLAYAYINADIDEMENLYMALEVPEDVDSTKWMNLYLDYALDQISFSQKHVFTLDSKKIDGICEKVDAYQASLLSAIIYGDMSDEDRQKLIDQRNDVLQRITLAKTMEEIETFYGSKDGDDYFEFEYSDQGYGSNQSITLTYKVLGEAPKNGPGLATFDDHTVTIVNTLTDTGLSAYASNALQNAQLNHLTSTTLNVAAQDVANQVLGDLYGLAPGGGLLMFGIGTLDDIESNYQNQQFINSSWTVNNISLTATYFDCYGNVVLYDDDTVDIHIYEGINTHNLVGPVGDLIGNENLTTEYLVQHPDEVFQNCVEYMQTNGDQQLENILEGKN